MFSFCSRYKSEPRWSRVYADVRDSDGERKGKKAKILQNLRAKFFYEKAPKGPEIRAFFDAAFDL